MPSRLQHSPSQFEVVDFLRAFATAQTVSTTITTTAVPMTTTLYGYPLTHSQTVPNMMYEEELAELNVDYGMFIDGQTGFDWDCASYRFLRAASTSSAETWYLAPPLGAYLYAGLGTYNIELGSDLVVRRRVAAEDFERREQARVRRLDNMLLKIRSNLSPPRFWRDEHIHGDCRRRGVSYPKYKALRKLIGQTTSRLERGGDSEYATEMSELMQSEFAILNSALGTTLFSQMYDRLHPDISARLFVCGRCRKVELRAHQTDVYHNSQYSTTAMCRVCAEEISGSSNYVLSDFEDDTRLYMRYNMACRAYSSYEDYRDDSGEYCSRVYADENFYHVWDNVFASTSALVRRISGAHNTIRGYHDTERSWIERNSTPVLPALGIELEVFSDSQDRNEAAQQILEALPDEYVFMERDGSLDGDCGFEIITHPFGRNEWAEFGPKLLDATRKSGCIAFDVESRDNYGIHINMHRGYLSPLAEARIMMFLCAAYNRDFVIAIAQRDSIYEPTVDIGSLHGGLTLRNFNGFDYERMYLYEGRRVRKIRGNQKYAPINWKRDIAEWRLFQSTLNTESFMKNIDFVYALYKWTLPSTASGTSFNHRDFVTWLMRPEIKVQFPHLANYIKKASFPYKNGECTYRVHSTWADLIHRPSTDNFVMVGAS